MNDPDNELLLEALDLDETTRVKGPPKKPLSAEYVRDLTEADMVAMTVLPRATTPKSLARIHASHHSLARCLASGMKPAQAALVTGYAPNRISILCNDPAFKALVEDYRSEAKSIFADLAERMQ